MSTYPSPWLQHNFHCVCIISDLAKGQHNFHCVYIISALAKGKHNFHCVCIISALAKGQHNFYCVYIISALAKGQHNFQCVYIISALAKGSENSSPVLSPFNVLSVFWASSNNETEFVIHDNYKLILDTIICKSNDHSNSFWSCILSSVLSADQTTWLACSPRVW